MNGAKQPGNPLALDNQLCFALYSASHAMTKAYKPYLDALGLTYPQYLVMLVLWEQDAVPVKEIGSRLFLDSGTLTPLLKRLEAGGMLERHRDPEDERQVRIVLTADGRRLRELAGEIPERMHACCGQDPETVETLRAALASIRDDLCRLGAKAS